MHLKPLEEILVENSNYHRASLKARLLALGILKNKCSSCGLGSEWNGKPLVLHIEHKNGIGNDNRLENLAILCPNCHSQTPTYCGNRFVKKVYCIDCNTRISNVSKRCKSCAGKVGYIKGNRGNFIGRQQCSIKPSKEELAELLWSMPSSKIARLYGVSDKAVQKWCKKYNLDKPPRGYWTRQKEVYK